MAKTAVQYFPLKVCVLKVFNSLLFPCEGKHKQLVVVWKTLVHCKVIIIKSLMKGAALHIPQVQLSRWFRNAVLQSKNHTAELCSYEAFWRRIPKQHYELEKKIGRQEWILKSIEIETLEKTEMHLDSDEVSYAKAASK